MAGIVRKVYCTPKPRPQFVMCAHWSGKRKSSITAVSDNKQSRTQSFQAFWSAGQRREDSGDINLIDIFDWLCLS